MANAAERAAAPVSPVAPAQPDTDVEDVHTLFCRAASGSSPLEAGTWSRRSSSTRGWGRRWRPMVLGDESDGSTNIVLKNSADSTSLQISGWAETGPGSDVDPAYPHQFFLYRWLMISLPIGVRLFPHWARPSATLKAGALAHGAVDTPIAGHQGPVVARGLPHSR